MKDTEIEKIRQIVSRNDISGNEKVEMLIIFTENYHSIQLMQTAVVGQSGQLCYCGNKADEKYSHCCTLEHWHNKFSY
jgi:hypothetical protein